MGVFHWLWQSPLQQVSTTVLPVMKELNWPERTHVQQRKLPYVRKLESWYCHWLLDLLHYVFPAFLAMTVPMETRLLPPYLWWIKSIISLSQAHQTSQILWVTSYKLHQVSNIVQPSIMQSYCLLRHVIIMLIFIAESGVFAVCHLTI